MDEDSSEDERDALVTHIVTVQQILLVGLELFYKPDRIARVENLSTNIDRFNTKFGIQPVTACMLYEDLQKTNVDDARINQPDDTTLKFFLLSLHYLRKYPTSSCLRVFPFHLSFFPFSSIIKVCFFVTFFNNLHIACGSME